MDIKKLFEGLGANKEEVLRKGLQCKSAEEILQLAQENGLVINEAEAAVLLASIQIKPQELSDDELDTVAGGLKEFVDKRCPTCKIDYVCCLWDTCPHCDGPLTII